MLPEIAVDKLPQTDRDTESCIAKVILNGTAHTISENVGRIHDRGEILAVSPSGGTGAHSREHSTRLGSYSGY